MMDARNHVSKWLVQIFCVMAIAFNLGCGSSEPAASDESVEPVAPASVDGAQVEAKPATEEPKVAAAAETIGDAVVEGSAEPDIQPATATPTAYSDGSEKLLLMLTVFMLAVFVGVEIITKIPPTLHTPLMSGSNAISGITLIGALLATGSGQGGFATFLGFFAVVFATVNVIGGFLVTHRMLDMFRKKK